MAVFVIIAIVVGLLLLPHGAARLLPDGFVGSRIGGEAVIGLPIAATILDQTIADVTVAEVAVLGVNGAARRQRVARIALERFLGALVTGLCTILIFVDCFVLFEKRKGNK